MKPFPIALVLAAVAVLLAFWADPAEATTVCQGGSGPAVANTCQGYAHVSTTTGGVASARCFAFRTTNTAPTCSTSGLTPVNEAWTMDPGACITLRYFDTTAGVTLPAAPNKVSLWVTLDNTGTTVILFQAEGSEPANGDPFTFCATTDGLSGSPGRAGTYQARLRAIKDDAIGGVGEYDVTSYSGALVGSATSFDRGALRSTLQVSNFTRSAYPAGSTFAYGTSGDEVITLLSNFTTPNVDANLETMRFGIADAATMMVGAVGSTVDVDSGTLTQAAVADQTFPSANSPYQANLQIIGNAALTGSRWTTFASSGHMAGVSVFSDLVLILNASFNIDPDIAFDKDGSGVPDELAVVKLGTSAGPLVSVLNKGEQFYSEFYLLNARGEQLTRTMDFHRKDDTATDCGTGVPLTPTSGLYSFTGAISTGSTCVSVADETGEPRFLHVENTDQDHLSDAFLYVSSLYFVDAHTQISSTLSQDDFPTENANEDFNFTIQGDGMGGDDSDTIHGWCHVVTVRKDGTDVDTSGNAVAWTLKDPTAATRSSGSTDTGADGWTGLTANMLASTPLGMWEFACTATFNGNTGTYAQDIAVVVAGGNGTVENFMADPLKVYTALNDAGDLLVAVSASYLNGTARTGAASELNVTIYDPSWTAVVSSANPDEVGFGAYSLNYTPLTSGLYFIVVNTTDPSSGDPVGVSNAFALNANVGSLMHDTAFATLTGLTGSEFAALLSLAVVGVILWLRSTDVGVRAFGAILPMVAGVLVLLLTVQEGVGTLWSGSLGLGAMLLILGGYLLVRLFLDDFLEKRAAGEA